MQRGNDVFIILFFDLHSILGEMKQDILKDKIRVGNRLWSWNAGKWFGVIDRIL